MRYFLIITIFLAFACKNNEVDNSSSNEITQEIAYNMEIGIKGMTCTGCEETIESSLLAIEGIEKVEASHGDANAMILFEGSNLDTTKLKNSIAEAGYTFTSLNEIE